VFKKVMVRGDDHPDHYPDDRPEGHPSTTHARILPYLLDVRRREIEASLCQEVRSKRAGAR
jgi:hypothetical protein